ncbi:MAG: protein-L-isoaspartate(D-aspartate) O-methyltransferase [Opitutales bacterium]|nr:protein-L-isoaspartate(D-aspartate) O-methyltransferase [Opitutales bacterium]
MSANSKWLSILLIMIGFSQSHASPSDRADERVRMVEEQIEARGVEDPGVLDAMRKVERHRFVIPSYQTYAYTDQPLPIDAEQTISQPFIVAHMTELLQTEPSDKILEIGTGSGYQAAVLGELVEQVYTIEVIGLLADKSRALLKDLGYENVHVRHGDGYKGWPEEAPFDGIIVTAAPPEVPQALLDQLKVGARLVIPVGRAYQELKVYTRTKSGHTEQTAYPVRFVPMVEGE